MVTHLPVFLTYEVADATFSLLSGTVELRWRPLQPGRQLDCTLAVRAISVRCEQKRQAAVVADRDLPEHMLCMRAEWQEMLEREPCGELAVRDRMLRSFCPQIHGMYLVKLAVLLALSSGMNARATPNGGGGERRGGGSKGDGEGAATAASSSQTRGCSHVILVGDPGLAKSKLLQFAAAVAVRAVHTTGMGCSSAGLTAAAVKVCIARIDYRDLIERNYNRISIFTGGRRMALGGRRPCAGRRRHLLHR